MGSGCRHQYHANHALQNTTVPNLHVAEAPHADAGAACFQPAVGFHHILWSSVTADAHDHYKSVIDPMAVVQPGVHTSTVGSFNGCQGSVQLSKSQVDVSPLCWGSSKACGSAWPWLWHRVVCQQLGVGDCSCAYLLRSTMFCKHFSPSRNMMPTDTQGAGHMQDACMAGKVVCVSTKVVCEGLST